MSETPLPDDTAISEAASQKPAGQRRGRPKATPREFDKFAESNGDGEKSRRTVIKRFHTAIALGALSEGQGQDFGYLTGPDRPRWDILAELGRLEDPAAIREAAAEICRRTMKTKQAVALLRQHRTGKAKPGDVQVLAEELARTIDNYLVRHPATTSGQVQEALERVLIYTRWSETDTNED